jgi:protein-L-isoaspartate(D-aspartate) O-methyltransferase
MVESQLVARGITDPNVIRAMLETPRHVFVPETHQDHAYRDGPLGIACQQTISQPYMVALMTQLIALKPTDRVLEIGTGSGYQAAVLSRMAKYVISVERHADLTAAARQNLTALGIANVSLLTADGSEGLPDEAPFDAIMVTAGAPEVPEVLKGQLADGGRLVCPAGSRKEQTLELISRRGETFQTTKSVPCVFVPLIGASGWEK